MRLYAVTAICGAARPLFRVLADPCLDHAGDHCIVP